MKLLSHRVISPLLEKISRWKSKFNRSQPQTITIQLSIPPIREILRLFALLFLLGMIYGSWLINLFLHKDWIPILDQIFKWFLSPRVNFSFINFSGWPMFLMGWAVILVVGTLIAHVLLPTEEDLWLKRLLSIVLGLGSVGILVILLGIFSKLSFINLNLLLSISVISLLFQPPTLENGYNPLAYNRFIDAFRIWQISKEDFQWEMILLTIICFILFIFMQFHTLSFPEFDWDSVVYHATMAKLIFQSGGFPFIAGPSIGLELSANYPPLFSALGAFFYTEIGAFNDAYIRMIPPFAAILVVYTTYKSGAIINNKKLGYLAAIILLLTPLFFYRSLSATNYMLTVAFLNFALLFILLAYTKKYFYYWIVFGVVYGFALLTSYHALFFLPSIILIAGFTLWKPPTYCHFAIFRFFTFALFSSLCIGGIWFIRNIILVGNPIYPFGYPLLGGKNLDKDMLHRTISGVRYDSLRVFFGTDSPTIKQYLSALFINNVHYPILSVLSLVGLIILPFSKNRRLWAICLLFITFPYLLITSTVANIFPRYILLFTPQLALVTASVLTMSLNLSAKVNFPIIIWKNHYFSRLSISISKIVYSAIGVWFALILIFPGSFSIIGGKGFSESDRIKPPKNILRFVTCSKCDLVSALEMVYWGDARAWEWLNLSLSHNHKIATFENKTYYIADSRPEAFFYLDGWEALELYQTSDPEKMVKILKSFDVQYILDPAWIHHWEMYKALPLNKYLGWPKYFPLVFTTPSTKVYQVGQLKDPLTRHSSIPVSISPKGWTELSHLEGRVIKQVISDDERARIYVSTLSPTILKITYLDQGFKKVTFNLLTPDNNWEYDFKTIELHNTGEWQTATFVLATKDTIGFIELGVYSSKSNFIVSKIEAERLETLLP